MYEVVKNGVVIFRSVSLQACKNFINRRNLVSVAVIQPMAQMLAA